jgi:phosphoribosyl 1,2-cyclic phosphodiesterase
MKIRLWGTRGSIPAPGPSTLRYGGNTSCVEVLLQDGSRVIIDAGSGIRPLGAALGSCDATLLLSHYHWDHIQGMPFFGPAYSPKSDIRVCGPEYEGEGPWEILAGQMLCPYFPAPAEDWLGIRSYEILTPDAPFRIGSALIRAGRLSHPGLTFGFRIEEAGHTFVYASDDEPEVAPPELFEGIIELAWDADLLLHDCQYTDAEYETRRGWGHSTPRQAAAVAAQAGVRTLLLFHHDPSHSDEQVEALADEVRCLVDGSEVVIGREGETILVGEPAAPKPRAIARSSASELRPRSI